MYSFFAVHASKNCGTIEIIIEPLILPVIVADRDTLLQKTTQNLGTIKNSSFLTHTFRVISHKNEFLACKR